ncbi:nucleotidyltransferase/DNA polymerase involved in DNA repair [Terriglobus roseus DSM 18391]|uniref:Nucleotidyltransferase/DNA polymerase involved in DNA repair n=1 Tax=Terriglobus roseus (strain DSM 18391 / NRRL B-41598 / KBS 63) TaxID=926566 RepID=I3ZFG7_TERRK|nr:nucleotidyltransferase/DNA polymerase involved in DNA repair [Terriglobus roseus]AFL87985.1 nucleotidyltransferase/DNA polymerase involved in DNA repair [Terriglobus roseus DSM 18391]
MTQPQVYLAVHVPEFAAQALLRMRPDLQCKPVAVVKGIAPLQEVCSANTAARAMGVENGITRAQLDAFDGLTILPVSAGEEACARTALLDVAAVLTPRIEPQPMADGAFRMLLDMTGTTLIWGQTHQLAQRVAHAVSSIRLSARVVASSNAHASLSLAAVPRSRPLVVNAGDEAKILAPLPLSALHLSQEETETFQLWGLRTLGELAMLPVRDVVSRIGQRGKHLHAMARGEHPHHLVPQEEAFKLEEQVEFEAPVDVLDSLLFVLGPMLDQLIYRAANRSYALASVTTHLRLDGGGEHERTVQPALPNADRAALLKLMQLDLQAHPPDNGIVAITLTAQTGDRSKVQMGLFAPQLPEAMRLDVTIARIAALVGEDSIGRARLLDTHGMHSFAMDRFLVKPSSAKTKHHAIPRQRFSIRRHRPPVPLHVSPQYRHNGSRPFSFYLEGKQYVIAEAYGPWRCNGDWWSSDVWSHEEWDVRARSDDDISTLLLCLLNHDLLRKTWTLEATYD